MFHPNQRNWALAASWTNCAEFGTEPCKIYKELFVTKNLGEEWTYLTNYVYDFEWGQTKFAESKGVKIPPERVFVTRDDDAKGHQSDNKDHTWSTQIDLFVSDDLFRTNTKILEQGNTIVRTPQYMFIAVSHADERRVKIYSSNYESGFMKFRKVRLPRDAVLSNTFTLMDTSEQQVFLFIENHGETTPFGNLYISDEKGRSFTLSMTNVIKGHAVDFEKVNSLDGTYVINRYNKAVRDQKSYRKADYKEFDEVDIIAEENKKGRMQSRASAATNGKTSISSRDVQRIPDSIPEDEVYGHVRSYITHNKGATWDLIRPPTVTSRGNPIDCHVEDECSLHIEIYSHNG